MNESRERFQLMPNGFNGLEDNGFQNGSVFMSFALSAVIFQNIMESHYGYLSHLFKNVQVKMFSLDYFLLF